MPSYGRQLVGTSTGIPIHISADGDPEYKTGGITLDWNTVPAVAVDTVLGDGVTIPAGQKGLEYGTIVSRITASGKYGPFTPTAAGTTLNGATLVGATTIVVASAAGIVPGDTITIDTAGNLETRTVTAVAGTTVTVTPALTLAHANGVAVAKPDDGRQTLRRGESFILDETVLQNGPLSFGAGATDHPDVLFGGRVWKARIKMGGANQPTQAAVEAAFPRLVWVTV
jgi:hypothetical protein